MPPVPASPSPLESLLDHLKATRGFDFTGYKRTTLERRITKRMKAIELDDYVAYRDHLEANTDEFAALFDTILINVTGFFRDAAVWEHMAEVTIPDLLASVGAEGPIRVWCAGCSTGEETYTLAILLAEALGEEAYLERVKVYATDVDEDALAHARLALYDDKDVEAVPEELIGRYFNRSDSRYAFRKDLRRTVIFGRNDLVSDPPISRIDLLLCRNTLMYFNAETQGRILRRLHFALNDWGTLTLGKSEMLILHSDLFRPKDLKRRLFVKVPRSMEGPRGFASPRATLPLGEPLVRELAFDWAPTAQVVVDDSETVVAVNRQARTLFGVGPADLGRPLRDLELSYRPVELRAPLETAVREQRTVGLGLVHWGPRGRDRRILDVDVVPMGAEDRIVGATVIFADVTVQNLLQEQLEVARVDLQNAYEELQTTVEELETTNEELQSTNEELETTNEELQSTVEELGTINEELQSTNQELETINDELRGRTRQLDEVNVFLETILTTMQTAVVVVDGQLVVQLWNEQAEELFGLRLADVQHRALLGLDVGLPFAELTEPLRSVLRGAHERAELDVDATDRRGRDFRARVTLLPLAASPDSTYGAVLLISAVDAPGAAPPPPPDDAPAGS